MPSTSKKQARMMAKARNDPEFRERMGISKKAAVEFNDADRARAKREGSKAVFGTIRRRSRTDG